MTGANSVYDISYNNVSADNLSPLEMNPSDGTACFNGLATKITFTFPAGTTLNDNVIFGIAYNTSTNGYTPEGYVGNHPENSLNIATYPGTGTGLVAVAPSVGTWSPDGLSVYAAHSVAGGGSGVFTGPTTAVSTQMNDFGGYMPAVEIAATN
jgi:hypothetical protein